MTPTALIVCVSVSHGNTARVARAMADVLHAEVRAPEEVDPAMLGEYDLVGFGSGIYYSSAHPRLRDLVEALPDADGAGPAAFVFTTSGQGRAQHLPWQRPISGVLGGKGYDVLGSFDCRGYDTWLPLRLVGGVGRGHPDADDLDRARAFALDLAGRVRPARHAHH